jgi:hypothetical protein
MSDTTDKSQKYLGRHVCTAAEPYEARKHGTHAAHPDARIVGGSPDGAADDFRCPNCGTEWRAYYDD